VAGTSSPRDLLTALDERLRTGSGLDLALSEAAAQVGSLSPVEGLGEARKFLVRRVADLQAALVEVSGSIQQLRELQQVVRFTEAGWPERERELATTSADRPQEGLGDWLDDWFTAMAALRLDACRRLVGMASSLPAGTEVLVRRCLATSAALESGSHWEVASPLLLAGARGVSTGTGVVPSAETRQHLWELLVRFALALGREEQARSTLDEARAAAGGPVLDVLAERMRDRRPGPVGAETLRTGANSVDVLLEIARVVIGSGDRLVKDLQVDAGMAAARKAVSTATSLDQAVQQLTRLLEPIPPELHLALAERAVAQGDDRTARDALGRALDLGANGAVRAEAHEHLADLARRSDDPTEERRQRLAAAQAWSAIPRADRALACAEAVLAVEPEDPEARYDLAVSLLQLSWGTDDSERDASRRQQEALRHLRRALEVALLLRGLPRSDDEGGLWSRAQALHLESWVRDRLAEFDGEPRVEHRWRALAAALEAVAIRSRDEAFWTRLAAAAYELELWSLAELSAGAAARMSPWSRDAVAQHVLALINLGEYTRALDVLGEPVNAFEWNMKAHLLLHQGDAEGAAAVFNEHPPELESDWARGSHYTALLLQGRRTEAVRAAKEFDSSLRPRSAERSTWGQAARVSLLLRDDSRVASLAEKARAEGLRDADSELAVVRAGQGQPQDAASLLASFVGSFTSFDAVQSWLHIDHPVLEMALQDRGVAWPDQSSADIAFEEVQRSLAQRRDPVAELDLAAADSGDDAATEAAQLGRLLVAVAKEDLDDVQSCLASLRAERLDLPWGPLDGWARSREQDRRAAEVVEASTSGHSDEATELLRQLLGDAPGTTDELLRKVSPAGVPVEVLDVLRVLAGDPQVGPHAESTLRWLHGPVEAPELDVRDVEMQVALPQSWFADTPDPTSEHPLFLRQLSEMRLLGGERVPPIRVKADTDLEPVGYRVVLGGDVVEQGSLPVGGRLLAEAALQLVPDAAALARPEEQPALRELGELTIPDADDAESTLAGLLSRSALEVLVVRLERLSVRALAQRPG